jgi:hypothetical protein
MNIKKIINLFHVISCELSLYAWRLNLYQIILGLNLRTNLLENE